jgi:HD-GYP domain-containing protein (c-di-GMP phosphodiesterase class II)
MTTTRPYRKAMPIEDALKRLEDASGSQLDARLVEAFVTGMRTEEHAPLPATARRERIAPVVLHPSARRRTKKNVA